MQKGLLIVQIIQISIIQLTCCARFLLCTNLVLLLSFCSGCFWQHPSIKGLSFDDLAYDAESVIQYFGEHDVKLSEAIKVHVSIEISTKGNGVLNIDHEKRRILSLKIYDRNIENDVYDYIKDGLLKYVFYDYNNDGILDLRIYGTVLIKNDKSVLLNIRRDNIYYFLNNNGEIYCFPGK